jgi:NADPH:quinone reductase-like Zn-dependent oxidoreductase
VLISDGGGSLATYAIQLAKLYDAIVISTVSSDVKVAHAEQRAPTRSSTTAAKMSANASRP